MSKHTPEPWEITTGTVGVISSISTTSETTSLGHFQEIVATCMGPGDEKRKANARRIVACVNFCKGITTEKLEELVANGFQGTDEWTEQ